MSKVQPNISVLEAKLTHINLVLPLFNKYRKFYEVENRPEDAKAFIQERIEKNQSKIFLAIQEEKAIGFTQLYPSFSSLSLKSVWILNDLFVDEDFRKQGVGKMLLDAAKDFAIKTKSKGLTLSTGIENETAQSLYEKYGFIRNEHFYEYFLFF
nr:GNAT family N-acetyltransferase [Leptospiraceae bacterium]